MIIAAVKAYIFFSGSRMFKYLNTMELQQKIKVIYDEQKLLTKMVFKIFFFKMAHVKILVRLNFFYLVILFIIFNVMVACIMNKRIKKT